MDELDSLKDWLVIVEDPFIKPLSNDKLKFHVAWNEFDQKVTE